MTMIKTGEASALCGVSRETMRNWVDRGEILPNSRTIVNPNNGKKQYLIDSRDIEAICEPDKARAESRVIAASLKMEERAKKLEKSQRSFENMISQFRQEFYNEARNKQPAELTPLIQGFNELKNVVKHIQEDMSMLKTMSSEIQKYMDTLSKAPHTENQPTQQKSRNILPKEYQDDYEKFGGR